MCKYDIPVYIGKADSNTPEATNICKVLYIDIRSGAAVVFNRATKKYETIRRTAHFKHYISDIYYLSAISSCISDMVSAPD